jgi:hypothetical protein
MGIGGLFDYWAGNVSRAPHWLRRLGHEWLWRLFQQPSLKARRYLIGNPLFLAHVLRSQGRFKAQPASAQPDGVGTTGLKVMSSGNQHTDEGCGDEKRS